jgi:hypothetical protein
MQKEAKARIKINDCFKSRLEILRRRKWKGKHFLENNVKITKQTIDDLATILKKPKMDLLIFYCLTTKDFRL